jgi:hypothetical protein
MCPFACHCVLQEKKAAEEARKKELEALFATTIKQPKVPPGVQCRMASRGGVEGGLRAC